MTITKRLIKGSRLTFSEGDANLNGARDDTLVIRDVADFPAPVSDVITLVAGTNYLIQGNVDLGINRIVMSAEVRLIGVNQFTDGLIYTGTGGAMFTIVDGTSFYADRLTFDTTGTASPMFVMPSTTDGGSVVTISCQFFGQHIGTLNGGGSQSFVFIERARFIVSTQGLEITGTFGSVRFIEGAFAGTGSSGYLLDLDAASISTATFSDFFFGVPVGVIGIDASTAVIFIRAFLVDCIFFGAGTFTANIDCTNVSWEIRDCVGVADTKHLGGFNMEDNAVATVISGLNAFTPIAGTTVEAAGSCQFEMDANNSVTYLGLSDFTATVVCSFDLARASGSGNIDFEATIEVDTGSGFVKLPNIKQFIEIDSRARGLTIAVPALIFTTGDKARVSIQQTSGTALNVVTTNLQFAVF